MIKRRLYRQGNSIVLAIPSYMLESLKLNQGDSVLLELHLSSKCIVLKPDIHSKGKKTDPNLRKYINGGV